MSTVTSRTRSENPSPIIGSRPLADVLVDFVQTFDTWSRRAAVANARESVPRLRLLYELHCNGPRKMADLAESLGVTPRNVTALVDGLEAESLVRRVAHPSDRRVTMVEITGGATEVEQQFRSFRAAIEGLLGGLSEADRRTLERVLPALVARIETLA
jgi:DNA-binding MarR family transcriptional regulator